MRKTHKNYTAVFTALTIITAGAFALSGCSRSTAADMSQGQSGIAKEETAGAETTAPDETQNNEILVTQGDADTMVETGNSLYFKYKNDLWRMDKEGGKPEKIRTFENDAANSKFWIYNNNLYFDMVNNENYTQNATSVLYRMNLETKKEEKLTDLSMQISDLYASDGKLYLKGYETLQIFALKEDGSIDRELSKEDTVYGKIPEGCEELYTGILPLLTEQNGYMALSNGENLVIADEDGENARGVTQVTDTSAVIFAEDAFYAIISNEAAKYVCKRFDIRTLEEETIFESDSNPTLLQYRDGYLYYMENDVNSLGRNDSFYYRVNRKDHSRTQVGKQLSEPGTRSLYSFQGGFYVTKDEIICRTVKDYGVYLQKTSLADLSLQTLIDTPLFQSGIQELGEVQAESKTIPCPVCGKTAVDIYAEKLVFKGNTEAVTAMNKVMEEAFSTALQYEYEPVDADSGTCIHTEAGGMSSVYSMTYEIEGVTYLDDRYCSIRTTGYEYTGGAHGNPYRNDYLFDRTTGKRLELKDVIKTSEAELKTLVSGYFRALSEKTQFSFSAPEDLEKEVADRLTMDTWFYMTDRGIVFYYYPYDIAPYAAGFPEVLIPFDQFDLKIEPGKPQ